MELLSQDFSSRLLRKNHQTGLPSRVIYLDTETRIQTEGLREVHYMRLGWTCACRYRADGSVERESWREWREGCALWKYIEGIIGKGTSVYLFAHNAFFDLQASSFFEYMTEAKWMLDFYYDKGPTYILVLSRDERTLRIVSTTNFYECSLKELGEMVGLKKLEVDFAATTEAELSVYCRRDVEILKAAMERYFTFLRENDLGRFRMSKASQAMSAFRHRFMDHRIYLHDNAAVRSLEREGYFGGRVECFFIGKPDGGPFLTLDVNSMYPYVMQQIPVPIRLVDYRERCSMESLTGALKTFAVVARVELETEEPVYAVRRDRKVIFPVGSFEAVLCTPALSYAIEHGHITSVWEMAVYEKAVIFESYVAFFYELRVNYKREKREVESYVVKKLLNALYGKWAQKRAVVEEEVSWDGVDYWRDEVLDLVTGKLEIEYKLFHRWVRLFGEEDDEKSFCAVSAHITEAARMHLWKLLNLVGRDRVLYCDTDSLKIRSSDVIRLWGYLSEDRLGGLKIEGRHTRLEILGPKAYICDGRRTIKGVPAKAEQVGPHSYRYRSFLRQATHMREGKVTGVLTQSTLKQLRAHYDKGHVKADGQVVPFRVAGVQILEPPPPEFFASSPQLEE